MRVWRSATICLELMKRAIIYYSAAEDIMNLKIWARVRSIPFVGWDVYVFGEKYAGPCLSVGFDFIKEGQLRVPYEDHAAGTFGDAIIWVCGYVVE